MNHAVLETAIAPLRRKLCEHPLHAELDDRGALALFMRHHVFAVWDFMSLLMALRREVASDTLAWIPPANRLGARLVNEIVLAEESDDDARGGFVSHFEMYHEAMTALGADTGPIDELIRRVRQGEAVGKAMAAAELPDCVRRFVGHTFAVIASRDPCQIAAAFSLGREDLLPNVFLRIIDSLRAAEADHAEADNIDRPADSAQPVATVRTTGDEQSEGLEAFRYYLLRHVELDGDHHGPMAMRLLETLCGRDPRKWQSAQAAAESALLARLDFWNAIHRAILTRREQPLAR